MPIHFRHLLRMITPAQSRAARGLLAWTQQISLGKQASESLPCTNWRPERVSLVARHLKSLGELLKRQASSSSTRMAEARACAYDEVRNEERPKRNHRRAVSTTTRCAPSDFGRVGRFQTRPMALRKGKKVRNDARLVGG